MVLTMRDHFGRKPACEEELATVDDFECLYVCGKCRILYWAVPSTWATGTDFEKHKLEVCNQLAEEYERLGYTVL